MRAMTILKRVRDAERDLNRLQLRIRQRDDALRAMGGVRMDPNGGSRASGDGDRTGRLVAEKDQAERELQERKDALMAEITSAMTLLEMVPDLESEVLHRYYVLRDSTGAIARAKKYTESYVRKKKRDGEEAMELLTAERVDATLPRWYLKKWPDE